MKIEVMVRVLVEAEDEISAAAMVSAAVENLVGGDIIQTGVESSEEV
jgi:hypothetical protein